MFKDYRNLPVSASGSATVDGINEFIDGFLGYETKAAGIVATADGDADSPLANTYAALACMLLESCEAPAQAAHYVARASAAARHATERERMVLESVSAWVEGDVARAIAVSEEIATRYPRVPRQALKVSASTVRDTPTARARVARNPQIRRVVSGPSLFMLSSSGEMSLGRGASRIW